MRNFISRIRDYLKGINLFHVKTLMTATAATVATIIELNHEAKLPFVLPDRVVHYSTEFLGITTFLGILGTSPLGRIIFAGADPTQDHPVAEAKESVPEGRNS